MTQYGKELQDLDLSQVLNRYIRGAQAKILSDLLAEQELAELHKEAIAWGARKAQPNTLVQKGGTVYSYQARAKVRKLQETELERAQRALE